MAEQKYEERFPLPLDKGQVKEHDILSKEIEQLAETSFECFLLVCKIRVYRKALNEIERKLQHMLEHANPSDLALCLKIVRQALKQ